MHKVSLSIFYFLVVLTLVGCSNFRKIEKNPDWRVKYEGALNYYNKKDYYRASVLFEQILPIVRGLPEGEKVQFYLANCQFHDRLYLLASEQFRTFYQTYGRSTLAEEARYMYAYSLFKASPNANLDQSHSIEAMAAMQEFLNRYQQSTFRDRAIEVIVTIQEKLEKKGFENARQYYKMRWWNAAVVSLENFKQSFPDSDYLEEAHYLMVMAQYKLAEQSVLSKQEDRYKNVVDLYLELVDKYPKSNFLSDAEKAYSDSLEKLNKLKTRKNNT